MQTRKKKVPLTETVKQFLIQSAVKNGSTPSQLMGEMELCEKFQVARGTVRQAIQDVIDLGYAMRLPKRRGLFSVPFKKEKKAPLIGILDDRQQSSFISRSHAMILSGFFDEMFLSACDFSLPQLNTLDLPSLKNFNVDALLWITPPKESFPLIRQLIAENYPIVVVPYLYSEDEMKTDFDHFVYVDYLHAAKKRAELFTKHHCRNILICGGSSLSIQLLEKELKKNPEMESVSHWNRKEPEALLKSFLKDKKIDGIFSFGGCYSLVIEEVRLLEKPSSILIQFDPGVSETQFQKSSPDLNIQIGNTNHFFGKRDKTVGKEAAQKLKKILNLNDTGEIK